MIHLTESDIYTLNHYCLVDFNMRDELETLHYE